MAERERSPLGFQWGFWPLGTVPAPGATVPPRADRLIPRYYRYAGLPFGCRTAPYAFTQFMLVLARYLRRLGISVLGYIDGFAAVCSTYDEGVQLDRFMRHTFASLGLVLNFKKSTPEPTQRACVLGIDVDLVAHTFAIPDKRKSSIAATAKSLLRQAMLGRAVSVRDLASLTGKVMSCHIVLGDMAHLFTRSLFRVIAVATGLPPGDAKNYRRLRALWRTRCRLTTAAQSEAAFWLTHIADALAAPIAPLPSSVALFSGSPVLFQDASDHAFGAAWLLGGSQATPDAPGVGSIARNSLTAAQSIESSTLRELHGVLGTLVAFETGLCGRARVFFFTDSDCCFRALTRGSPTPSIHALAMEVHAWAMVRGLELRCLWMRRNKQAASAGGCSSSRGGANGPCGVCGRGPFRSPKHPPPPPQPPHQPTGAGRPPRPTAMKALLLLHTQLPPHAILCLPCRGRAARGGHNMRPSIYRPDSSPFRLLGTTRRHLRPSPPLPPPRRWHRLQHRPEPGRC